MIQIKKRIGAALCAAGAAAWLSAGFPARGEELVDGFPRSFNFRNLILVTEHTESLEYAAFCGATDGDGAYIVSFNLPSYLELGDKTVIVRQTDIYGDGKGVTKAVSAQQIYESDMISVNYTEDFSSDYLSRIGDAKMAPVSSLSEGDRVFLATFDDPNEPITDYGYVLITDAESGVFIVLSNEEWLWNDNITYIGAPLVNEDGAFIGVLAPMTIDEENPTIAAFIGMDDVIEYLKEKSAPAGGSSSGGGSSGGSSSGESSSGGGLLGGGNGNGDGGNGGDLPEPTSSTPWIVVAVLSVVAIIVVTCVVQKKKKAALPQGYGQPYPAQPAPSAAPPVQPYPAQSVPPVSPPVQPYPAQSAPSAAPPVQPQNYGQPAAPVMPAERRDYQMFNSQESLEKNQVPPTTFLQASLTLKCTGGTLNGSSRPITGTLCIGRNPAACNVVYPQNEPGVSGTHCKITVANGQVQLTDMGSTAGTFLNGIQVLPNVPYPLTAGSSFYLGSPANTFTVTE